MSVTSPHSKNASHLSQTHCYSTNNGHRVYFDMQGSSGPVLVSFHGGGLVEGGRQEDHRPKLWTANWPGVLISADYHLLVPGTGLDIVSDVKALFDYFPSLDISHHEIFVAGFSGGGYPMRLAAMLGAEESKRPVPRFRILGCISYCGMGGDFMHSHWFTPQEDPHATISAKSRETVQQHVEIWRMGKQCSNALMNDAHMPSRNSIWESFLYDGSLNDSISGIRGLSNILRDLPHSQRLAAIPTAVVHAYPQAYFRSNASRIPSFLLVHGDSDTVVPIEESIETLHTLKEGGGKAELVCLAGANHGLCENQPVNDGVMAHDQYALNWMLEIWQSAAELLETAGSRI